MKKITAFLLALVLAFSLCTMVAATDETVTIVLEPADDTLLTAEGLALFFVDRAAIDEEIETSVFWYKETTKDGKTERELIDAMEKYAPEKDTSGTHHYCMHRIFGQSCLETGLRYGTCWHCLGIEFDLARGSHIYGGYTDAGDYHFRSCTVCGAGADNHEEHMEEIEVIDNEDMFQWTVYCPICGHIFGSGSERPQS